MQIELFDDNLANEKIKNYEVSFTCPICLDELDKENNYCIIDCKHEFHSKSLINWFRSGKNTCPMCRNTGESYSKYTTSDTLFKMKIKYATKNMNASKEFKKIVNNYLKTKEKVKDLEKEKKEVTKEMKELKKEEDNLSYREFTEYRTKLYVKLKDFSTKIRKYNRKKYDLEKAIEIIPIKPVILLKKKINKKAKL